MPRMVRSTCVPWLVLVLLAVPLSRSVWVSVYVAEQFTSPLTGNDSIRLGSPV